MRKIQYPLIFIALLCLAGASLPEREFPRRGKDFALFIAVQDYQNWSKLRHPIREVKEIAQVLRDQYSFDTRILENPTQEQIITAVRDYIREYPQDGQLLIYLSGHGDFDELTKEGFFIPKEGRLNDAAQTSYLSFSRLKTLVENIPCRHILLAIDACYSGTFDKLVAMRGTPAFGRPGASADARESYIARELQLRSRFFVASGKKEQTPDASNFAAYFLRALRSGGGDDAVLSMDELIAELKKAQPRPHFSTFGDHQDESNFLFIKDAAPPPPPDVRQDRADWLEAQRTDTPAAYRNYLQKYPQGEFRALAQKRLAELEAEEKEIHAWRTAQAAGSCQGYQDFIRDHPQSPYRPLAEMERDKLCRDDAMVFVKGGTFQMGDVMGDKEQTDETVHTVTVSDFYISKYEVTFGEYDAFCTAIGREKPDDGSWGRDKRPVINVSWLDAVEYCNWLSGRHGRKKVYTVNGENVTADWNADGYRLPTEAEWEYAARGGGRKVRFGNGKDIADPKEINFNGSASNKKPYSLAGEYRGKTIPVGSLNSPNALGLHDMSGNVWEWCWGWYGSYPTSAQTNPKGPGSGSFRVRRGGSWGNYPQFVRVALRVVNAPGLRNGYLGFRLARSVE